MGFVEVSVELTEGPGNVCADCDVYIRGGMTSRDTVVTVIFYLLTFPTYFVDCLYIEKLTTFPELVDSFPEKIDIVHILFTFYSFSFTLYYVFLWEQR